MPRQRSTPPRVSEIGRRTAAARAAQSASPGPGVRRTAGLFTDSPADGQLNPPPGRPIAHRQSGQLTVSVPYDQQLQKPRQICLRQTAAICGALDGLSSPPTAPSTRAIAG